MGDDDIEYIRSRRRPHNRIGFALQLCAFRYPGRLLSADETIPAEITEYLAAQLGLKSADLMRYAHRLETRREHLTDLRAIYGYKMFSGGGARDLKVWLEHEAETARSNMDLAHKFIEECRRSHTILPGISVIERLCADALVAAERWIETRIVKRLTDVVKDQLDVLLTKTADAQVSQFIWLRQFEVGKNSAGINRLLDRLEFLQGIMPPIDVMDGVPPHQITRLRRQGERYFTDGLRDISSNRRLAILAVCAVEWRASIADAIVENHDRIVGKIWRDAKRSCDVQVNNAKASLQGTLRSFKRRGTALLEAKGDDAPLDPAVTTACGWHNLESLVVTAAQLSDTMSADPLNHVVQGYHRFRRYAPRMLRALDINAASIAEPLMVVSSIISENIDIAERPTTFLRHNSKWLAHSRRYGDLRQALVLIEAAKTTPKLMVPFDPDEWLNDRKVRMADGLKHLAQAAKTGAIPGGSIENDILKIDRLTAAVPVEADELVLDLYRRLPDVRITDMLLDVEKATGFTDAFTHLRTGAPCKDRVGLLNVLLAEGLNLGLSKIADATNTHDYFQLSRLSSWHIESDAINKALDTVIKAQSALPMAQFWGGGVTASSDGQFFPQPVRVRLLISSMQNTAMTQG